MKKSILLFTVSILAMSVSSCFWQRNQSTSDSVNPSSQTTSATSSNSESVSSSSKSSTPVSSTSFDPSTPSKKPLSYNYNDFIKYNADPLSNSPTIGQSNVLIIPIWFTDSGNYILDSNKASVRSDIEKAYLGSNEDTGWRSVKTYYEELSNGKLTLTGTVTDWYACGQASSEFYEKSKVSETISLVISASDAYFESVGESHRQDFDKNSDGYLDAVLLIYAAPDYGSTGIDENSNMWAYCYWAAQPANVLSPAANVFFWASYDFMYASGADAESHTGLADYGAGDTTYCNLDTHCLIHEMGHVMGLTDYYDYSKQYNPAGGFSMQDYNVGSHDPFSAMAYGYVDPYVPTQSMTIELKPFQSDRELIVLSNHNNLFNSPFDEYLLLELYTPTGLNKFDCDHSYRGGYPQGPNTAGIRLWHVDARLTRYNHISGTFSTSLTTKPTDGDVCLAMSNTYYSSSVAGYCSPLGAGYYDYNVLQLIRNDKYETYTPESFFTSSSLFKSGTFSMATYGSQFVNTGKLNSNTNLGWSFTVESCSSSGAIITVTKS